MRYLIFEPIIRGHHLEYISHMLSYALSNNTEDEFYFILNENFENKLINQCKLSNHILVDYISDQYSNIAINANPIIKSYRLSKCLKIYQKKYNPDKIILAFMPYLLPLLPIFIRNKQIIRGIIFKGPKLKREKIHKRIINTVLYRFIYKLDCFDRVWLVNNKNLVNILNEKYKTNVYFSLPDPININLPFNKTILTEYHGINKIILFHGGAMNVSKGTLVFINALKLIPLSLQNKFLIIFGGKIMDDNVREELFVLKKNYPSFQIIYNDCFITFSDLCSYISVSDYVVIPYKRTEQSSGILGYAALYNVPVIGPNEGLLGKIIRDYDLGITLKDTSSEELSKIFNQITKKNRERDNPKSVLYVFENSIKKFTNDIFSL